MSIASENLAVEFLSTFRILTNNVKFKLETHVLNDTFNICSFKKCATFFAFVFDARSADKV